MGVLARNSSERMRTIWTPEMDLYFIELMIEQVDKGNRIDDCLFSKRAWKNMTSLFNAKFKFQCDKEVLKNRHKTLRNLYKAVQNILEQRGFSWDETRQMVTADNSVWDEYIKVHHDARLYRIKVIPYYRDLCIIYRKTKGPIRGENSCINVLELDRMELDSATTGDNEVFIDNVMCPTRCDKMSTVDGFHEIMIDEDYEISVTTGDVNDSPQTPSNAVGVSSTLNRSRTYWRPPMDRYLTDLMLEQVQKGNQIDGVFRKQAWMEMIALFNAKFGFYYDTDILKNRFKTLKRQYNVISNLLEVKGFVWNDTRLMVTADDCVWQDYIKTHTNARQFMTRPVPYYKELCVICKDPSIDDEDFISDQNLYTLASENEDHINSMQESSHLRNKRQLHNRFNSSNKKAHKNEIESQSKDPNSFSIEKVIEGVQALPEMDEDLVLDACDFLEDEKKAITFLALDVKLRKKWLIRKLRPPLS